MPRFLFIIFILVIAGCSDLFKGERQDFGVDPDVESESSYYFEKRYGEVSFEKALTGDKSVKLSPDFTAGLTAHVKEVTGGERFEVSVWRNSDIPNVFLAASGNWGYYFQTCWSTEKQDEWEKLSFQIFVPDTIKEGEISIYSYIVPNNNDKTAYVDNLEIKVLESGNAATDTLNDNTFYPAFYLYLKELSSRHISIDSNILSHTASPELKLFYKKYGIKQLWFKDKLEKELQQRGFQGVMEKTKAFAEATSVPSVKFIKTEEMEQLPLSGYANRIVYNADSIIEITIRNRFKANFNIELYKMTDRYGQTFVRSFSQSEIQDSIFSFPAKNLEEGFYFLQLQNVNEFRIPFIVGHQKDARVAVLVPSTNYHAYNLYGGKSFYKNGTDSNDVYFISTRRPMVAIDLDSVFLGDDLYIVKNIFDWFNENFEAEIYPDYFLESHPELFRDKKTIVIAQHCEYFSPAMFENLEKLADSVNIISMGGNQLYWKVRWHNNYTLLECRKAGTFFKDTYIPGGLWRTETTSEARLLGVAFTPSGAGTYSHYIVTNSNHWLYDGTNVIHGNAFGEEGIDGRGLSGDETDKADPFSPPATTVIAKGANQKTHGGGEIVLIPKDDCAVLSTGSISSGSGLGKDEVFTRIVRNFMERYHR